MKFKWSFHRSKKPAHCQSNQKLTECEILALYCKVGHCKDAVRSLESQSGSLTASLYEVCCKRQNTASGEQRLKSIWMHKDVDGTLCS
eukprot:521513-Amphidinium_carterae.1